MHATFFDFYIPQIDFSNVLCVIEIMKPLVI